MCLRLPVKLIYPLYKKMRLIIVSSVSSLSLYSFWYFIQYQIDFEASILDNIFRIIICFPSFLKGPHIYSHRNFFYHVQINFKIVRKKSLSIPEEYMLNLIFRKTPYRNDEGLNQHFLFWGLRFSHSLLVICSLLVCLLNTK